MASPSDQGHEAERPNIYASASQWRHQESSAFARHAVARDAHTSDGADTKDLSSFLNQNRVEGDRPGTNGTGSFKPIVINGADQGAADGPAENLPTPDGKEIVCGPLLNYRHTQGSTWYGSVLIVTRGGGKTQEFKPVLRIGRVEQARDIQQGLLGEGPETNGALSSEAQAEGGIHSDHGNDVVGNCLYSDPRNTFWQFPLACDVRETETKWAYSIPDARYRNTSKPAINYFFVPAASESMRIMFHSCNGFSVGTDEDAWSGPALWNDVARRHAEAPFHVMIGGGDQIYNDGIRVDGPLRPWTDIGNPKKRRDFPFDEAMRASCDDYYLENYIRWYSTEPFANCNGQIPQLNIWDDHDIIDGYGTYADDFMQCDVFRGIGGTAHKYYLLFQHHLAPPVSTYTSDAPQTMTAAADDEDTAQTKDTFVAKQTLDNELGYIVGAKPGPYIAQPSLNMFARLGSRVAFMGVDARTERVRHQVNFPETYDLIFDRVRRELELARESGQEYKHLIVLLGIPIAYPRLSWLESIFSSRLITPIKFLNRKFGVAGAVFNQFDGSVDLLDDLQDHYTERKKKTERRAFIERLQATAAEFSVRVTILGGDVHLAALGRFYSNPKLKIPVEEDHRYIVNVISSAIVNKPPPSAVANLLARRNKIHHLNADTDETLMSLFNKDPGDATKTAKSNHVTMPSRNYTIITENSPNQRTVDGDGATDGAAEDTAESEFNGKDGHAFLHKGELNAGTNHKAAAPETHGKNNDGSLDCCIRVEIDQHKREGLTQPYGLTIPALLYEAGKYPSTDRHHLRLHNSRRSNSRPGTQPSHVSAP